MILRLSYIAFALLLLMVASFTFAAAQLLPPSSSTVAKPAIETNIIDNLDGQDIDSVIAPLSDKEARALLRSALELRAKDQEKANSSPNTRPTRFSSFLETLRSGSSAFSENFSAIVADLPKIGSSASHAMDLLTDLQRWPRFGLGVVNLIAMLAAAFMASMLVKRMFVGFEKRVTSLGVSTFRQKISVLLLRGGFELSALTAFFIAGQIVSLLYFSRFDPMRLFLLAWFSTVCVYFLMRAVARIMFAPNAPNIRLVLLSDFSAKLCARTLIWFVTIVAFTNLNGAMFQLLGVPGTLITVWQIICATLSFGLIAVAVFKLSKETDPVDPIPAELGDPSKVSSQFSLTGFISEGFERSRLLLSLVGTALLYVLWFRASVAGETSGAIAVIMVIGAVGLTQYFRLIHLDNELNDETSALPASRSVLNFCTIILWLLVFLGMLQALGLDLVSLAQTPAGSEAVSMLTRVGFILFLSVVFWNILAAIIQQYVRREHSRAIAELGDVELSDDGGSGIVVSRLGTLLPIFRGFVFSLLAATTVMFVLSSMGINIGPLLAGAGVVGIAIGFGAQTLVKDIFSGIFFLIDDAFRIGEYVEFEEYKGEVEKISIRSMQMRHHRGPIHTVPYGELRAITNHNRDWVIFKQEFQLPYEADIEKVRKIVKKIGQELFEDPDHGPSFIAPLKSQGVKRVENGVLVIGTKFTCKPREQWLLRRIVYQRVRDKLYENGIALAHRRVQIEFPDTIENGPNHIQKNSETQGDAVSQNVPGNITKPGNLAAITAAASHIIQEEDAALADPKKPKTR